MINYEIKESFCSFCCDSSTYKDYWKNFPDLFAERGIYFYLIDEKLIGSDRHNQYLAEVNKLIQNQMKKCVIVESCCHEISICTNCLNRLEKEVIGND
jgi:aspartate/tyrosine/aromatic aminotransferase